MLYGIDVSSWQRGLEIKKLKDISFVIAKATEGIGLTDKCCNAFIEQAKALGLPWGFYHYARNNSGKFDADYFYNATKNYFGSGLPILDYEDPALLKSGKGVAYAEEFMQFIYNKTGIYPVLYTSAAILSSFKKSWIPQKCALWLAGYPRTYTQFGNYNMPYKLEPWSKCIIWQFSGSGKLAGYEGQLDLDRAYIDVDEWNRLIKGVSKSQHQDELLAACRVVLGEYGTGAIRKEKLQQVGYSYANVQDLVNKIVKL